MNVNEVIVRKLLRVALLLPFMVHANQSEKDSVISMINDVCAEHSDPSFCRWQLDNITAISGIIGLSYSDCYRHNTKTKECRETDEAFNYFQKKYNENMTELKKNK